MAENGSIKSLQALCELDILLSCMCTFSRPVWSTRLMMACNDTNQSVTLTRKNYYKRYSP